MSLKESFSIRQMIEITGLTEFTIRGWENRYGAFSPRRGETGRRNYKKKDIEKAILLRELVKRGAKINKIAHLKTEALQGLFKQASVSEVVRGDGHQDKAVEKCFEYMALQNWEDLDKTIKKIKVTNIQQVIDYFFLPTLQVLAQKVSLGLISIAQEHILSSFLKEKIYMLLQQQEAKIAKKLKSKNVYFVLAAPEGDYHEIGLLLAHLYVRSLGYKSLFLGAHTPSKEISETALRLNATHILIVSNVSKKGGAKQDPLLFVSDIKNHVGPQLKVLFAGSQATLSHQSEGAPIILDNFELFKKYVGEIKC